VWDCYVVLDQGNVGACVGFSWAAELAAEPEAVADIDNLMGMRLYNRAQLLDVWPETPPEEGSSVLAGAKAVSEGDSPWIIEYRWAFGIDDLLETVSYFGPVVLGINWYSGMMNPDAAGVIHVTGEVVGGHAILCRAVFADSQEVILHNSWGRDWGINGTARLSWSDLDRLLHEDGEACVPVLRVHIGEEPVVPIEPEEPVEPIQEGCLPRFLRGLVQRR
jgi:hypothetical protein